MRIQRLLTGALWLALLFPLAGHADAGLISQRKKLGMIRKARVWQPVDVEKMDLLNGPGGFGSYKQGQPVPCKYEEKDPRNPLGGHSKKFPCWDEKGTRLKIKYGPDSNKEVFGEVAGSRLFWALGFWAEKMYSVKIVCENCPVDPWEDDGTQPRDTREFEPATIQTKLEGDSFYTDGYLGWSYDELEYISEKHGGAPKAQVDALILLTAFVNHVDNTPNQQKILCLPEDPDCEKPVLFVTDLGGTFGGKSASTSFRNWSRKKDVWKDPKRCVADLPGSSFKDPVISEAGRKFLAGLLGRLSEAQIHDLFQGARFDLLADFEYKIPTPDGRARKVTIDDWVQVFLRLRKQVQENTCPQ